MDTTHSTRAVNEVCGACSGPLRFVRGQARCVMLKCPLYWKGQGGIETLVPSQGYVPNAQTNVTVIQKPQDL
jgi:hypothetical protein